MEGYLAVYAPTNSSLGPPFFFLLPLLGFGASFNWRISDTAARTHPRFNFAVRPSSMPWRVTWGMFWYTLSWEGSGPHGDELSAESSPHMPLSTSRFTPADFAFLRAFAAHCGAPDVASSSSFRFRFFMLRRSLGTRAAMPLSTLNASFGT